METDRLPEPRAVLDAWLLAANAGDVDDLVELYAAEAVLIPTFAQALACSEDGIRAYFEQLAAHEGLQVTVQSASLLVRTVGPGLHGLYGHYRWSFRADAQTCSFDARFSFTLACAQPRPILHHHSSVLPVV